MHDLLTFGCVGLSFARCLDLVPGVIVFGLPVVARVVARLFLPSSELDL